MFTRLLIFLAIQLPLDLFGQRPDQPINLLQRFSTQQNVPIELSVTSTLTYADPYNELVVDALITAPGKKLQVVPAFWDGNNNWKIRYSSPDTGTYNWQIRCNNKKDRSLNKQHGIFQITTYTGSVTLYKKGTITTGPSKRYFQFADGTPFFWLGDTWWKGLCKRINREEFRTLASDRKSKGFNVIQLICGPYPDEPPFDARWANEGGMPYTNDYDHPNPAYFDSADLRIKLLVEAELLPAIVGGWGWHMDKVGVEHFVRHWRYLIARYGAYPVTWIVGGEAGGDEWTEVARKLRAMDPYHRLLTMHSYPGSGRMYVTDESVLDYDMLQTGHGGFFGANSPYGAWSATASNTVSKIMSAYSKTPSMPVLIGEVTYEGHMQTNGADVQRQQFWSSILSGAAGHTYGAGGIWQMNSDTERGAEYEFTPWFKAMLLPGANQLGMGKRLLERYPWWQFSAHPEWVDPHSTSLNEPHAEWFDDSARFADRGNRWDLPYAAGIAGEVRIIYVPGHYYDWSAPTIRQLEPGIPYHSFLVDPSSGRRYDLGVIINEEKSVEKEASIKRAFAVLIKRSSQGLSTTDFPNERTFPLKLNENPRIFPATDIAEITWLNGSEFALRRMPAPQDWLIVLERVEIAMKSSE